MNNTEKVYGVADRAWQAVVGCSPKMPCASRCWARRTVARIVKCQEPVSPERAALYQVALTADGSQWSGKVFLDEKHLTDPLKWKKPAVIATGFHGDWGRLPHEQKDQMAAVMMICQQHEFMPLTKCPQEIVAWCERLEAMAEEWRPNTKTGKFSPADVLNFRWMHNTFGRGPAFPYAAWLPKNASIGCSVMYQSGEFGADHMREPMRRLSDLGWRTHVWYEPALGQVDWTGWEFVERIIYGGESGNAARPNTIAWARNTLAFCRAHGISFVMKQAGAYPRELNLDSGHVPLAIKSRKGDDLSELPEDLRVRQLPEVPCA